MGFSYPTRGNVYIFISVAPLSHRTVILSLLLPLFLLLLLFKSTPEKHLNSLPPTDALELSRTAILKTNGAGSVPVLGSLYSRVLVMILKEEGTDLQCCLLVALTFGERF